MVRPNCPRHAYHICIIVTVLFYSIFISLCCLFYFPVDFCLICSARFFFFVRCTVFPVSLEQPITLVSLSLNDIYFHCHVRFSLHNSWSCISCLQSAITLFRYDHVYLIFIVPLRLIRAVSCSSTKMADSLEHNFRLSYRVQCPLITLNEVYLFLLGFIVIDLCGILYNNNNNNNNNVHLLTFVLIWPRSHLRAAL